MNPRMQGQVEPIMCFYFGSGPVGIAMIDNDKQITIIMITMIIMKINKRDYLILKPFGKLTLNQKVRKKHQRKIIIICYFIHYCIISP